MNYNIDSAYWPSFANAVLKAHGRHAAFEVHETSPEYDDSMLVWKDEGEPPTADAVKAALAELRAELPARQLRAKRDALIAETDWWVLPDRTPTQEQLDYRQALRDLPANTEDPENPVWPVKPGG